MKCPECGSTNIYTSSIESLCRSCGLIIEDSLIEENPFIERKETTTFAGTGDIQGKIFKKEWFYEHHEKKTHSLWKRTDELTSKMNIPPSVLADAKKLILKAQNKELLVGRDSDTLIIACVYCSCLNYSIVRTHLDFELYTGISRFTILRYYRELIDLLKIPFKRFDVPDLIEYYGAKLHVCGTIICSAVGLWNKYKKRLEAKPGYAVASALLYLASNGSITQGRIAFCSGVHDTTIRKILKCV